MLTRWVTDGLSSANRIRNPQEKIIDMEKKYTVGDNMLWVIQAHIVWMTEATTSFSSAIILKGKEVLHPKPIRIVLLMATTSDLSHYSVIELQSGIRYVIRRAAVSETKPIIMEEMVLLQIKSCSYINFSTIYEMLYTRERRYFLVRFFLPICHNVTMGVNLFGYRDKETIQHLHCGPHSTTSCL